jgi:Type IV secretion-system coupling protein DNA-binding domain
MLDRLLVHILNAFARDRTATSGGLLLGTTLDSSARPVHLPDARRFEHVVIVGKTGVGKTHCLEQLANQHFERREGFCFIDYHGDATDHLVRLAARYPDAEHRLALIDPTDPDRSPGLNPLEITDGGEQVAFSRSAELAAILKQRWGVETFGARTEELMRNTLYTLAANGYTIIEASLLLTSRTFRSRLVAQLTNPEVVAYWQERYEPLTDPMKAVFREPLLNKVSGFVTDPASRHLLGQQTSTLNFAEAMSDGRWVLINLSKGRLRDHAHTLGNLIFARLQFDVMARAHLPEQSRRLYSVFCDEVQNLAENDLMILISEGRKYRISLFTANQFWEQLPRELRAALLSAGTHIFFRVSAHDASTLAAELSTQGRTRYIQQLTGLPRGQAVVRVGWEPPALVRVPALVGKNPPAPQVTRLYRHAAVSYSRPRAQIEAEIRQRRQHALSIAEPVRGEQGDQEGTTPNGQTHW